MAQPFMSIKATGDFEEVFFFFNKFLDFFFKFSFNLKKLGFFGHTTGHVRV